MTAAEKPRQSLGGLLNISFGFFGIQIGFALQNANMSRIFQSLGSSLDDLPALWVAAPLTGLLVQPVIGHLSDRTWLGRFGRRRPYFLAGALLATLSLIFMPQSSALLMAALLLWMLDASLNVCMEPFRAFVGDMLHKDQHTAGYGVQTAFIGAGAVVGSMFPYVLDALGVSNSVDGRGVPDTVRFSFWFGGAALLLSVLWTVVTTREYSPEEIDRFEGRREIAADARAGLAGRGLAVPLAWIAAGSLVVATVARFSLEKEVYLLGALLIAYGLASAAAILLARGGRTASMLSHIIGDFSAMPPIMKRLAVAQFFAWSALFIMWINTTPVVAQNFFGSADPQSQAYQDAGNWAGVLFAVYNAVAAVVAVTLLPWLAKRIGRARTHMLCLLAGAAGFLSFFLIKDARWLVLAEVGIGIAWASVLAMPYAILASALPQRKLGVYMGLFNVFIVIPQLLVATVMGAMMKAFFPGQPIWTMLVAGIALAAAAAAMLRLALSERRLEGSLNPARNAVG
jgi:maltose/moltooligosaccharide transporter